MFVQTFCMQSKTFVQTFLLQSNTTFVCKCKASLSFKSFGCKARFCSNILHAKQHFCSNIWSAKQDFFSNLLGTLVHTILPCLAVQAMCYGIILYSFWSCLAVCYSIVYSIWPFLAWSSLTKGQHWPKTSTCPHFISGIQSLGLPERY